MKKIFAFVMSVLMASTMLAETKTIYCKMSHNWWTQANAAIAAYAWKGGNPPSAENASFPGVRMKKVDTDIWAYDVDLSKYEKVIFVRVNPSGSVANWGAKTADLTIPNDKNNLYTIDAAEVWADKGTVTGSWSEYTPSGEVSKVFYLTGDEAFVTGLGLDKSKAWNPGAKKIEDETASFDLEAGSYVMKITVDGTWSTAKGYSDLTELAIGLTAGSDDNICFSLAHKSTVKVTYSLSEFKLVGEFDGSQTSSLNDGYYLIGQHGWEIANISETNMFVKEGDQYKLEANLAEGQTIKVVEVKSGRIEKWYPDGMGTEYKVDRAHAGKAPIYFQTEEKAEWKDFGGYFYIDTPSEPDPDPEYKGVFYITGNEALVVAAGLDKAKAWNPDAYKSDKDTAVLNLKAGDYQLKITLDGKWATAKGFSNLTEKAKGVTAGSDDNICFSLKEDGQVSVIYNGVVFKVIAAFDESKEPVLTDGYYLIGQNGWSIYDIKASFKFEESDATTHEYKLDIMLAEGQTIKVVEVKDQAIVKWFPEGEGNEYKVDASHAGAAAIYFKATEQEDEAWKAFGGFMYIGASDNPIVDPDFKGVFYITGNEALVGAGQAWNPAAIKSEKDTAVLNLKAGDYELKITLDGEWATAKGYSNLTERAKGLFADQNNNICFSLKEDGQLKVIYNGKIFKLEAAFDESKEVTVADGFYLIGQNGWSISALSPALKFEKNGDSQDEYMLQTTLVAGQKIKVVKVEGNVIKTWYPDGEGNEYTVDAEHAGNAKIYFKEAAQEDWKAFGGHIYIEATPDQAIDNTAVEMKASKTIENGQLIIIMNGIKYTVTGAIVK